MGANLCVRIASKAGKPVAGILTLRHGTNLVYKYGASDTDYNHLGGTAMLLWEAIKEAKQSGCESFDLGRSDLDNPGLITFKERWAAERAALTTWRTPPVAASPRRARLAMQCVKGIFGKLPGRVQTLAGRLLYRHVG
jgi:lipid II:glycine glycyltransferase (peptidoglycan interpeptide bridge formation enzyme)